MAQLEALMEKLRSKADNSKSMSETAKAVRMRMAEQKHSLDINDKAILRFLCLKK